MAVSGVIMGKMEVKGLEDVQTMLSRMGANTEAIIKAGIYDGAGVIASAVADALEAMPTDSGPITSAHQVMRGPLLIQKEGLKRGFGISKMRTDEGFINVKIGFDGYNDLRTKKYPNGQPNVLIARSIESGTSYMQKTPFVRQSVNKSKKKAIDAVQARVSKAAREIAERK